VLVGRVAHLPASEYPRLLAIAVLLRHSWCPQDLSRTAARLGLPRPGGSPAPFTSKPHTTRDRGHRRRDITRASLAEPRTQQPRKEKSW
jgi:hypothetical protein